MARRPTPAQREQEERDRSLHHMKNPDEWHHLGRCPIKKRDPLRPNAMPEVGYLLEGAGPIV